MPILSLFHVVFLLSRILSPFPPCCSLISWLRSSFVSRIRSYAFFVVLTRSAFTLVERASSFSLGELYPLDAGSMLYFGISKLQTFFLFFFLERKSYLCKNGWKIGNYWEVVELFLAINFATSTFVMWTPYEFLCIVSLLLLWLLFSSLLVVLLSSSSSYSYSSKLNDKTEY